MKQEKESIEAMKANKYFSTFDAEYEQMKKNIRTVKKVFSEMLVRFENFQRNLSVIRKTGKWSFVLLRIVLTGVNYGKFKAARIVAMARQ